MSCSASIDCEFIRGHAAEAATLFKHCGSSHDVFLLVVDRVSRQASLATISTALDDYYRMLPLRKARAMIGYWLGGGNAKVDGTREFEQVMIIATCPTGEALCVVQHEATHVSFDE